MSVTNPHPRGVDVDPHGRGSYAAAPASGLGGLVEVRFVASSVAVLVAATACHVLGAGVAVATVAVLATLGAGCLVLPIRWAVASGACAWAYLTGFAVNSGGQLTFTHADLARAVLLLGAAVLAGAVLRRRRAGS